MFTRRIALSNAILVSRRFASNESKEGGRRFMQTIPSKVPKNGGGFYGGLNYKMDSPQTTSNDYKWSKHSLLQEKPEEAQRPLMGRRSRTSRFAKELKEKEESIPKVSTMQQNESSSMSLPSISEVEEPKITPTKPAETTTTAPRRRRTLKPRKALITLSSAAIDHLKGLLNQPEPQLIRIGVKNRGCSGLTYHLEYVTQPGKFDETVEQDGVKVLIDSKALFSIVGSEMDWLDDKLSSRFIFKNPNSKGTCGCGESFMV